MSVTIKDIASRTGVSMATVSRVINNSGYVSSEKRKLVEEAIAEFNFVPSAMAKGLSRQNSNMVGALIPEIDNPFFSGVIHGITEVCDKKNLNLILCSTNESPEREQRFVRALREQRICGLIVASSVEEAYQNTDYAEIFQNMDCPVVLIDRNILWSDLDGVFTEDAGAMTELVSCLLNEGHRHIENDCRVFIRRSPITAFPARKAGSIPVPIPAQRATGLSRKFSPGPAPNGLRPL